MALIYAVTPEMNIWENYPNLKLIREFKQLKDDLGDEKSSNIIKIIFTVYDPKSQLRDSGIDHEKLLKDSSAELLGDADFNWEPYDEFKDFFLKANLSKLETTLVRYEQDLEDLDKLLESWKWSKKDITPRATAVKQRNMLYDELIKIQVQVKAEVEEAEELFGGYQKSLLENYGQSE